ncbi:hypothetical protein [Natranaeroarchaeum aerophilus]|uniref:PGF-CTERM sorting domain-containing protein n=1 Tax=Natranaeroarchaeum aerophilus TaxID=2917711 RepID=A0AAE3K4Y2_9EURY|nr:hypothetical protein [Natranaeroarchaeum aerophilus]MCL9813010.1 hypothetical protein [Natranaeroarchaeum aerophilus]
MAELSLSSVAVLVLGVGLIGAGAVGLAVDMGWGSAPDEGASPTPSQNGTADEQTSQDQTEDIVEEPYIEPVPERGDPYFEAEASDGSWISYVNPRDEYRDPYLGDGSGKLCVSLYNADGEVAVGETIPNTTVTVPTGESLDWHSHADPFVVEFPLTEQYERPLDADQFGTDPDLPQGDGYLDSHCMEIHGMPSDGTIEYGEATIDGEYEDRIEVVGYIQQDAQSWETDVDPLTDARSYEVAGGGWTYDPEHSHGQMVVVLQLDHGETDTDGKDDDGSDDTSTDDNGVDDTDQENGESTDQDDDSENADDENRTDQPGADNSLSGFGIVAACVAMLAVAVYARRR